MYKNNKIKMIASVLVSVFFLTMVLSVPVFATANRNTETKVQLNEKKEISHNFDENFEKDEKINADKEIVIMMDSALNQPIPIDSAFDYALFNGSDEKTIEKGKPKECLTNQGSQIIVEGSIHSNNYLYLTGDNFKCSGVCESTFNSVPYIIAGLLNKINYKEHKRIDMPELSQKIKELANTDDFTVIEVNEKNYADISKTLSNVFIDYNSSIGFEVKGQGSFNIPAKTVYIFDGDVKISTGGPTMIGESGAIEATGNIILQGNKLQTSKSAFLYSADKSISIELGNSTYNGILYAPNGKVNLQGENIIINGCVVAKILDSIPGTTKVIYSEENVEFITKTDLNPKKTYMNLISKAAKSLVKTVPESTKIGVIKYDASANDNDYKLYNVKTNRADIEQKIDGIPALNNSASKGKSNLGDGLRRAYEMLTSTDGNPLAAKYILVLGGSVPNTWTKGEDGNEYYEQTGDAPESLIIKDDPGNPTDSPKEYAELYAYKAVSKGITPIFVNCLSWVALNEDGSLEENTTWNSVNDAFSGIETYIKTTNVADPYKKFELAQNTKYCYNIQDEDVKKLESDLTNLIYAAVKENYDNYIPISNVYINYVLPEGVELYRDISDYNPNWIKEETGDSKKLKYKLKDDVLAGFNFVGKTGSTYLYKLANTDLFKFDLTVKYVQDKNHGVREYTAKENGVVVGVTVNFSSNDNIQFDVGGLPDPVIRYYNPLNVNVRYIVDIN